MHRSNQQLLRLLWYLENPFAVPCVMRATRHILERWNVDPFAPWLLGDLAHVEELLGVGLTNTAPLVVLLGYVVLFCLPVEGYIAWGLLGHFVLDSDCI